MNKRQWKLIAQESTTIICPYCLRPITRETATIEHEPPKSRQKELGKSEKYIVCKKCNHEKGALTLEEYKEWKRLEFIRNGGLSR